MSSSPVFISRLSDLCWVETSPVVCHLSSWSLLVSLQGFSQAARPEGTMGRDMHVPAMDHYTSAGSTKGCELASLILGPIDKWDCPQRSVGGGFLWAEVARAAQLLVP